MKKLILPVVLATLAACAQPAPAPAPAPEPAPAPVAEPAPAPTPAEMFAGMAGKYAITQEGCAATNASRDGVVELSATTVQVGLDVCTVTNVAAENAGVVVNANCVSGEGQPAYDRPFSFVSAGAETMTWISEGGEGTPYVRCM